MDANVSIVLHIILNPDFCHHKLQCCVSKGTTMSEGLSILHRRLFKCVCDLVLFKKVELKANKQTSTRFSTNPILLFCRWTFGTSILASTDIFSNLTDKVGFQNTRRSEWVTFSEIRCNSDALGGLLHNNNNIWESIVENCLEKSRRSERFAGGDWTLKCNCLILSRRLPGSETRGRSILRVFPVRTVDGKASCK